MGNPKTSNFPEAILDPYIDWRFLKKLGLTPEEWIEKFKKGMKEYEGSLQ